MSEELKDILSNLNKDIEQEELLQYLNNSLKKEKEYEVEQQMNIDEFLNDAVEGLQQINDKKSITVSIGQLNAGLKRQLDKKKKKKEKRKIPDQRWVFFTIVLILVLIVIAFLVVKKFN